MAISKSEGFFLGSYAMNWSVDIRDENKLFDHQFTFVSKQQLNLFSFSQLTSCSRKKKKMRERAFQLFLMKSKTKQRSLVSEHVQWLRGGGREEAGRKRRREVGITVNLTDDFGCPPSANVNSLAVRCGPLRDSRHYYTSYGYAPTARVNVQLIWNECPVNTAQDNREIPSLPCQDSRWE